MSSRTLRRMATAGLSFPAFLVLSGLAAAQELPLSGVNGVDVVWATDAAGTTSQLTQIDAEAGVATPLSASHAAVPSRWSHRRRTLQALETDVAVSDDPLVFLTPLGDAVGNGGIHFLDVRGGTVLADTVVATGGNPPGYDLRIVDSLDWVFSAEDDGAGGTTLRGWSFATAGLLAPLNPATLTLPGSPGAYVQRIGLDEATLTLHVLTATGVQLVALASGGVDMALGPFVPTGSDAPATNPVAFDRPNGRFWIAGTSLFNASGDPTAAGWLLWKNDGSVSASGHYGVIPGRSPIRRYVPAIGAEELAVVSDGTDAWAYFLLRDPDPSSGFIRDAAVGVTRMLGSAAPVTAKILGTPEQGECFSIPSVHGARVAMESSMGPPWFGSPPGGAEKLSILYSPLDPLGAATSDGVIGVAGPLGGRVSCKGMERPLWSDDGRGVYAFTSHFAGAPNPATPGIEYLIVPQNVVVDGTMLSFFVVDNPNAPNQSIMLSGLFLPHDPAPAAFLDGFTFVGTLFHDGVASSLEWKKKKLDKVNLLGHEQAASFTQSPFIPDFPAILPPRFDDPNGSLVAIPANFGARRVSFDLHAAYGLEGMTMVAAMDDQITVQPAGQGFLAELGLLPPPSLITIALPSGWITTSEIRSW